MVVLLATLHMAKLSRQPCKCAVRPDLFGNCICSFFWALITSKDRYHDIAITPLHNEDCVCTHPNSVPEWNASTLLVAMQMVHGDLHIRLAISKDA